MTFGKARVSEGLWALTKHLTNASDMVLEWPHSLIYHHHIWNVILLLHGKFFTLQWQSTMTVPVRPLLSISFMIQHAGWVLDDTVVAWKHGVKLLSCFLVQLIQGVNLRTLFFRWKGTLQLPLIQKSAFERKWGYNATHLIIRQMSSKPWKNVI